MVILVFINIVVFNSINLDKTTPLNVVYDVLTDKQDTYQVLYSEDNTFNGEMRSDYECKGDNQYEGLLFNIPMNTKMVRFDFGTQEANIRIKDVKLTYGKQEIDITSRFIQQGNESNDIGEIYLDEGEIKIRLDGTDPYIVLDISDVHFEEAKNTENIFFKLLACIGATIMLFICKISFRTITNITGELYTNRKLVWDLSKNDFKTKYAGSYLGIIWAFIQPVVTVLIYWFVFQVGFKSAPMNDFPFVLWLVAGIIPWFFFNEALLNATNSLLEYNYLVKKVVFKISILPIVKIMSSLYVHIFFIIFANVVYLINGYLPTIYMIQIIYYSFCTFVLTLAIAYATSAMIVFLKDLGQIVNIMLQFGMWMTPIMWSYDMISPKYQWILKLNPMYYIVEGYRDTFIRHVWFWERFNQTVYFWVLTLGLFVVGIVIFKKLKNHFADVL